MTDTLEQIIRVGETDFDGNKTVRVAIRKVRGVSFMLGNAISNVCEFSEKKIGELSETQINKLEEMITKPEKFGIPSWLLNRRRDPIRGFDRHIITSQLQMVNKTDINELKKKKCYRGVRHIRGLPVRGQRTQSSFRRGKVVGVNRKSKRK